MRVRAAIGITLVGLAIAGALLFGFLPRAVPVELVAVARGPLQVTFEEEGKTRVSDRYAISAPVAGHVRRIDLAVGDAIKAGQTVAVIEPAPSSALDPRSRAQAAAALRAAEALAAAARDKARAATVQADLARQELERIDSLRQSKFVSEQAVDKARAAFDLSQAAKAAADHDVSAARFELERARAALAYTTPRQGRAPTDTLAVRAPVAAQVLKLAHESEGTVQAGTPLLEVGNPEALEVEVEVLSSNAVRIAPGTRVLFDRWGGDKTLEGRVRVIEPTGFTKVSALGVEEQRVRVIADFVSPRAEWRRIGDGYRVEARFVVWEAADILQIPASALFRHDNGWAVFVADAGRARLRPIEVGQRSGLHVQILSGLEVGTSVIVHPDDTISDGARLKPR